MSWRARRIIDGILLHDNAVLTDLLSRALEFPPNAQAQAQVHAWLGLTLNASGYSKVSLIDARGVERFSIPETPLTPAELQESRLGLHADQVSLQDFSKHEPDGEPYLALLVPIFDHSTGGRPFAVVRLEIDPSMYLYPLIERWPAPTRTAETLLVRRDGNDVLFLNELRFQKHAALQLRFPLTQTEIPAVKVVLGQEGIVEGLDYRGLPAIAALRAVPGTPWFLVSRISNDEAFRTLEETFTVVAGALAALLLSATLWLGILWRQQQAAARRDRFHLDQAAELSQRLARQNAELLHEVGERRRIEADLQLAKERIEVRTGQIQRSNMELAQFAYIASHDLQEPLRMVAGYVQLLEKRLADKLDADTREFMAYAVDGAKRMQNLIDDILAYSRVGTQAQRLAPVDSGAALQEALDRQATRIAETGAEIHWQSLPVVLADYAQLVQLFQNLIANAIKFCKDQAPRVRVEAVHEGQRWRFSVTDNGIGIAPEYRGHLRLRRRRDARAIAYPPDAAALPGGP